MLLINYTCTAICCSNLLKPRGGAVGEPCNKCISFVNELKKKKDAGNETELLPGSMLSLAIY